ncbi:MAG: hypothetical protein ACTIA6_01220 [Pseudoclavibacter sp.]
MRTTRVLVGAVVTAALITLGAAVAASAATVTNDSGPITALSTTPDLSCNADLVGTPDAPVFGLGTACFTAVAAGGTLNTPADFPLTGFAGAEQQALERDWSPISQSTSGNGTILDPYVITTVVAGDLIQVTQIDTFTPGASSYATSVEVENVGDVALQPIVYRVADCARSQYEALSYAAAPTGDGSVACNNMDGIPTGQWGEGTAAGDDLAQLVPLTDGSKFEVDQGRGVGAYLGFQVEFNDVALSLGGARDNFIGLSWSLDLAPGTSSTVEFQTHFSASDQRAVPVELTSEGSATGEATVTASFGRADAPVAISGDSRVTLPAGASYVSGSSTIGEPTITGDILVFTAPVSSTDTSFSFRVAGGEAAVSGNLTLAGSTADGVDFVRATTRIEMSPRISEPTATPTSAPTTTAAATTPIATPTATAATSAPADPVSTASPSPTATPEADGLATTGLESNLAPLGLGAGAVVLVGGVLAALAVRRRHLG